MLQYLPMQLNVIELYCKKVGYLINMFTYVYGG